MFLQNVRSKKNNFLFVSSRSVTKRAGSGSISQRYTASHICFIKLEFKFLTFYVGYYEYYWENCHTVSHTSVIPVRYGTVPVPPDIQKSGNYTYYVWNFGYYVSVLVAVSHLSVLTTDPHCCGSVIQCFYEIQIRDPE
jgi:hypothetical protein